LENKQKKIEEKKNEENKEKLKQIEGKINETKEKIIQEGKSWKSNLEKVSKWIIKKEENKNELSKLQSPKEIDES
jgi:hypothetical protein